MKREKKMEEKRGGKETNIAAMRKKNDRDGKKEDRKEWKGKKK